MWSGAGPVRLRTEELREWLRDELLRQKVLVAESIAAVASRRAEADGAEALYAQLHDELQSLTRTLEAVVGCQRLCPHHPGCLHALRRCLGSC